MRLALCLFLLSGCVSPTSAAESKPNFLVIIADDMGFSDAGCYGGEIATPNLDALAAGGLRFTQFYNTARCWPTRAALMTGYYPQQIRRDGLPGAPRGFGGRGKRPEWARTIAEYLRPVGYRTYHSGKWHIDGEPTRSGFDRSDQTSRGPGFFESIKKKDRDPDYYRMIATAQHAIDCLKEHAEKFPERPFFQYVAFRAPHFPLHAFTGRHRSVSQPIRHRLGYVTSRETRAATETWTRSRRTVTLGTGRWTTLCLPRSDRAARTGRNQSAVTLGRFDEGATTIPSHKDGDPRSHDRSHGS